jgi:hypothetical protein
MSDDERVAVQKKFEEINNTRTLLGISPPADVPPLTPEEILSLRALLAQQATPWSGEPLTERMPEGWRGIPEMTNSFRVGGPETFTSE